MTELKRFFRDTGILLAFCGAFYLLTVLVNRLEGDAESDASDYSPARKRANVLVINKDWPSARIEFQKLMEQDPLNGYAWDGYASCLWEIRRSAIQDWNELSRSKPLSAELSDERDQQIADLDNQTRQALLKVRKFARYRYSALLRLAALECDQGNYDDAMDFLEEFIGRGYQTQRGLDWIENFGSGGFASDQSGFDSKRLSTLRLQNSPHGGIAQRLPPGGPPPISTTANSDFYRDLSGTWIPTGDESGLHAEPRFWDLVRREREKSLEF